MNKINLSLILNKNIQYSGRNTKTHSDLTTYHLNGQWAQINVV